MPAKADRPAERDNITLKGRRQRPARRAASGYDARVEAHRDRQARPRPRRRFGQNFLRSAGVIARLDRAIAAREQDHLVEIGPGRGALTQVLLQSACRLDAIELDRDLATPLRAAFSTYPGFTLYSADALTFDYRALADDGRPLRVVGNLPYNIATPLVFRLLEHASRIRDMHCMVQREVAQRLTAERGGKHWGRLGIMTQFHCRAELLFEVSPEAFDPPPKVQSAFVRLTPHPRPPFPNADRQQLAKLVRAAFARRRKTLRNNLSGLLSAFDIAADDIDPGCRAESLGLEDFVRLSHRMTLKKR